MSFRKSVRETNLARTKPLPQSFDRDLSLPTGADSSARLRRHEAIAWAVIWSAFVVLCLIIVAVFLTSRWYVMTATVSRNATMTVIDGVVALEEPERREPVVAPPETTLDEGASITTNDTSQAFVRFFDYSTMTVFPNSKVTLLKLRTSRFEPKRQTIDIQIDRGKVTIGVAPADQSDHKFVAHASQAVAQLQEGSYTLEVSPSLTQVRVREVGSARVEANGAAIELAADERTEIVANRPPSDPIPGTLELIRNGSFSEGTFAGWRVGNNASTPGETGGVGKVETVQIDGRSAVHFLRTNSHGTPGETFIIQDLHRDVSDFTTLKLALELKVVHQSLSGGGWVGSEYPVLVRVNYRSLKGENFVVFGFYTSNEQNFRTDNGTFVPANVWRSVTLPVDFMSLPDRPREIISIEVRASGHDYESYVSSVSLRGN